MHVNSNRYYLPTCNFNSQPIFDVRASAHYELRERSTVLVHVSVVTISIMLCQTSSSSCRADASTLVYHRFALFCFQSSKVIVFVFRLTSHLPTPVLSFQTDIITLLPNIFLSPLSQFNQDVRDSKIPFSVQELIGIPHTGACR